MRLKTFVVGALTLLLLGAAPATKEKKDAEEEEDQKKRPRHQKSLTKVRPGSILGRSEEEPVPEEPVFDLRSDLERQRDRAVTVHFSRLAELDAIAEIAKESQDNKLADRAEEVRRQEIERFRLLMGRFRVSVHQAKYAGRP